MAMEGTGTGDSTTQSGTASAAATPPASPPSSSASQAAGATNAAPVANPAREAYERLAKGEKPEAVNAELYQKAKSKTTPNAQQQQRQQPGQSRAAAPAAELAPEASQEESGALDEKDMAVLKRAKFDLSVWKHIPPSNRKAILTNLRTAQTQTDRDYQQARTGKGLPGPAATTQAPPPAQEEATGATDDEGAGDGQQPTQEQSQQQRTGEVANPTASQAQQQAGNLFEMDPSTFVDPADLRTLEALGGKDLADIHTRGIARVAQAMQQQVGSLLPVLEYVLGQENSRQLHQGIERLAKQPGFEALATEPALQKQLQAKAQRLLRAADGDQGYSFQDALDDAAAGLFKTNAHAIAQARLTKGRESSLRGQPDRGTDTRPDNRPLSSKERGMAIFAKLREGLNPDEARRAVDGQ